MSNLQLNMQTKEVPGCTNILHIDKTKYLGPPAYLRVGVIKDRRSAYTTHLVNLYKSNSPGFFQELLRVYDYHKFYEIIIVLDSKNCDWVALGFKDFFEKIFEALKLIKDEKIDLDQPFKAL